MGVSRLHAAKAIYTLNVILTIHNLGLPFRKSFPRKGSLFAPTFHGRFMPISTEP